MALCDQEDVEFRLQRDLDTDAPSITGTVDGLIADAQAHIEAEVGRELESDDREETFDGGRPTLFLKYWPVTDVTSVTEDGTALTVADDVAWYERGKLIRVVNGRQIYWKTTKKQDITVEYVGGYLTGEHDAELEHLGSICAEMVARAIRKGADAAAVPAGAAGQVQSVSLEGSDSVTYATAGGSATIRGGLTQFVFLEEDEVRQLQVYKPPPRGFA